MQKSEPQVKMCPLICGMSILKCVEKKRKASSPPLGNADDQTQTHLHIDASFSFTTVCNEIQIEQV